MAHAICFECGTPKRDWGDKCPQCSLDPRRDHESFAKSYILSTDRCDAGNDPAEQLGLPEFDEFQLDKISERIRAGEPYEFDEQHLSRVREVLEAMDRMTWKDDLMILVRLACSFWPAWLVIAISLIIYLWK